MTEVEIQAKEQIQYLLRMFPNEALLRIISKLVNGAFDSEIRATNDVFFAGDFYEILANDLGVRPEKAILIMNVTLVKAGFEIGPMLEFFSQIKLGMPIGSLESRMTHSPAELLHDWVSEVIAANMERVRAEEDKKRISNGEIPVRVLRMFPNETPETA